MEEQIQKAAQPVVPNSAPAVSLAPQPTIPLPAGNKKMLVALGILAVIVIVVLAAVYFYMQGKTPSSQSTTYYPVPTQAKMSPTPTPITSVNGSGDLTKLLNELNSTDTSSMQSDYNKAVSESGSL